MRKLTLGMAALAIGACGAAATMAEDLDELDPQIAQAFAEGLVEEAEALENLPLKVEGDIENATGVNRELIGLILVPQKELTPENIPDAVNEDPGGPLGHLFMSKGFAPVVDGKPLDASKMHTLKITGQHGEEQEVSYLSLAARHTDDDVWHLYGYGAGDKPVLDVQIAEGIGPGTQPIALEVRDIEEDTGTCYVTIFDLYQTSFPINYKEPGDDDE